MNDANIQSIRQPIFSIQIKRDLVANMPNKFGTLSVVPEKYNGQEEI